MDASPPSAESPPPLPTGTARGEWARKIIWVGSVLMVVAPPAWAVGIFLGSTFNGGLSGESESWLFRIAAGVALIVAAGVARRGLRRGSHHDPARLRSWGIGAVVVVALTGWGVSSFNRVKHTSQAKAVNGNLRQLAAATDQFFVEHPSRVFLARGDVIGPDKYIKQQTPVIGEDYDHLFPIRASWPELWVITMPWGETVEYDNADSHPPRPRDGVQVERLADGGRFETTWREGVRDGPFRAYYPDGKLWGEATYVKGRVVGPSWLYTRDGKKFDEFKDGEAIDRAMGEKWK